MTVEFNCVGYNAALIGHHNVSGKVIIRRKLHERVRIIFDGFGYALAHIFKEFADGRFLVNICMHRKRANHHSDGVCKPLVKSSMGNGAHGRLVLIGELCDCILICAEKNGIWSYIALPCKAAHGVNGKSTLCRQLK